MLPQQSAITPPRRSIEKASVWILIATLLSTMFIVIPTSAMPLITTKAFLLALGTLASLALYILARLGRGNIIFPPLALVGALWLPVAAYALSTAFSGVSFANAFWGLSFETDTLGFMFVATCLGTLSALVLRQPDQYRSFVKVGAWAFGAVTFLQLLIMIVGQFAPNVISPAFSILGSYKDLAFVLGFGVVGSLLTSRLIELSSETARILLVIGSVALVLLAIANSTVVWILVALVALGLFVEAVMRRGSKDAGGDIDDSALLDEAPLEENGGNHSLIIPLVVLVISLFFLLGGTLSSALTDTLHMNELNVRPSWQSTFAVAHQTFNRSAVFGTGPNTFGIQWLKYRDTSLNSTIFWNVNFLSGIGFIPTSSITTGFVGIFAWIAFLALFVASGLRTIIRRTPEDAYVRYVAILSFVGTIYLFTIAVCDVPNACVLALAFVFAGLFASTVRYARDGKQWGIIFSRSPRIGFVIVFGLTIILLSSVGATYTLIERYVATTNLARAQAEFSIGNLNTAETALKKAASFAQSPATYQLDARIARARLNEIVTSTTLSKADAQKNYQSVLSSGINSALTATSLDPSDVQSWLALGDLYAQAVPLKVAGAYDSAKAAYDRAKTLDPTNPQILFTIAQLGIANGNVKEAEDALKSAISLKQDYTDAIFLLSQLEVANGNVKAALEAALAAAYFTPNNPNILFQVGILSAALNDFVGSEQALSSAVSANPQFANARYFLAAVLAKQGKLSEAIAELKAIAEMSDGNATAVASQITALQAGKDPFPANLLSTAGSPVK